LRDLQAQFTGDTAGQFMKRFVIRSSQHYLHLLVGWFYNGVLLKDVFAEVQSPFGRAKKS